MRDNFFPIPDFYSSANKLSRRIRLLAIATISCLIFTIGISAVNPVIAKTPNWIDRSNEYAELLEQEIVAKECQSKFAIAESFLEIEPDFKQCRQAGINKVLQELEKQQTEVKSESLRLDLSILLQLGQQQLQSYELNLSLIHI